MMEHLFLEFSGYEYTEYSAILPLNFFDALEAFCEGRSTCHQYSEGHFQAFLEARYRDDLGVWWSEGVPDDGFNHTDFKDLYAQLVTQPAQDFAYAVYRLPSDSAASEKARPSTEDGAAKIPEVSNRKQISKSGHSGMNYMFMFRAASDWQIDGLTARSMAQEEYLKLRRAIQESKRLWRWGENNVRSKELALEAITYRERMDHYNKEASEALFKYRNPSYDSSIPDTLKRIDLHDQFVKEAKAYLIDHIVHCTNAGLTKTLVICGRGLHSEGETPKLRPAILEVLKANDFDGTLHSEGGAILVNLK